MSLFALKILIFKVYDAYVFWELSEGFQKNTFDRVIVV